MFSSHNHFISPGPKPTDENPLGGNDSSHHATPGLNPKLIKRLGLDKKSRAVDGSDTESVGGGDLDL